MVNKFNNLTVTIVKWSKHSILDTGINLSVSAKSFSDGLLEPQLWVGPSRCLCM